MISLMLEACLDRVEEAFPCEINLVDGGWVSMAVAGATTIAESPSLYGQDAMKSPACREN
jgi:hypothetical protein